MQSFANYRLYNECFFFIDVSYLHKTLVHVVTFVDETWVLYMGGFFAISWDSSAIYWLANWRASAIFLTRLTVAIHRPFLKHVFVAAVGNKGTPHRFNTLLDAMSDIWVTETSVISTCVDRETANNAAQRKGLCLPLWNIKPSDMFSLLVIQMRVCAGVTPLHHNLHHTVGSSSY